MRPHLLTSWLALATLLLAACTDGEQPTPTEAEAAAMLRLVGQSERLVGLLGEEQALFARSGSTPLTPDERERLLPLWATLIDHDLAFRSFEARFLVNWADAKGEGKERALVVGMAAHAAKLRAAVTLLVGTLENEALDGALNEASLEYGVAAGHLDRLAIETSAPQSLLLLQIGTETLERRLAMLEAQPEAGQFLELHRSALASAAKADLLLKRHGSRLALLTVRRVAGNQLQLVLDPLVEAIALWLGNSLSRTDARGLITDAQLTELTPLLQPGDIFLERRNWYLSNLGLPGFWPHAELYVGTPDDWAATLDLDPEVAAEFPGGLAATIRRELPVAWAAWIAPASDGEPTRVLEAISEGVVFSSLPEAAGADYLGVLRPRLSPLQKARALRRAFRQHGKPYDFDFDFLTQASLVCSELVWLAYQAPSDEGPSLELRLSRVLDRTTLPPNDLVAQFDAQAGDPDAQLEFVAFLDGIVARGAAVSGTSDSFRASWRRPKWELYLR